MARNEPISFRNSVEEQFLSSCEEKSEEQFLSSCEKKSEWRDLEKYWGAEKCRLQDCEVSSNMSNSLEKHLLFDDYINEPSSKEDLENVRYPSESVNGVEIKDIPTTYSTVGFQPHELIIIGTYVDKNIVPGFQYKVRKNLSEEHLFEGKALPLESVGLGYGKRITFKGDSLNRNKNFFWSDSHLHGFGLTFQVLSPDTVFRIIDTKVNRDIGRVTVNDPALSEDLEVATTVQDDGQIKKVVKIHFSGDVILSNNKHNIFYENLAMEGTAVVLRAQRASEAKVQNIILKNFVADCCLLLPEE